jgi:hypothetical protein
MKIDANYSATSSGGGYSGNPDTNPGCGQRKTGTTAEIAARQRKADSRRLHEITCRVGERLFGKQA